MTLPSLGIALLPVLLFLVGLILMDSYKLVARRTVLAALAAGAAAALLAYGVNVLLLRVGVAPALLKGALAPLVEETLKALWVAHLVRRERVGFLVDAGILGFAVGAGFALVENLYYQEALHDPNPILWVVRGLGTAVMHGGTTAIFGIVSKDRADRAGAATLACFVPGLALAAVAHAAFNLLAFNPLLGVVAVLVGMPLLLLAAFERSEQATRDWLGSDLDADIELLEQVHEGTIPDTPTGQYLESLRSHLPGPVVADILCLLEIHLELALRAKGMLLARAAGLDVPPDPDVRARLAEREYLEQAIGPTGRLAVRPLVRRHGRDLWQIHLMRQR